MHFSISPQTISQFLIGIANNFRVKLGRTRQIFVLSAMKERLWEHFTLQFLQVIAVTVPNLRLLDSSTCAAVHFMLNHPSLKTVPTSMNVGDRNVRTVADLRTIRLRLRKGRNIT